MRAASCWRRRRRRGPGRPAAGAAPAAPPPGRDAAVTGNSPKLVFFFLVLSGAPRGFVARGMPGEEKCLVLARGVARGWGLKGWEASGPPTGDN